MSKLSRMFCVDEDSLREDLIEEKNDLVLLWATKVPVRLLALRGAAHNCPGNLRLYVSCESGFSI